jgi:glucose-6-phosphate dehydrogenase assembly protein OpcA
VSGAPDLSSLIALGDKIVVDSARPGAPAFADLRTLIAAGCIVGDLAWTRLTRLRELLAQLIGTRDPASIKAIELAYRGSAPDPSVKYLQAWLRVAFPGAQVNMRQSAADGPGELAAVRAAPDLNIDLDKGCAEYEVSSRRQHANIAPGPDHRLLAEELNIMQHDPVFESALARMTPWSVHTRALHK